MQALLFPALETSTGIESRMMIEDVKDLAVFFKLNVPLANFLEGADKNAENRIHLTLAQTLQNMGYVLVNKKDIDNKDEKEETPTNKAGVSLLKIPDASNG